MTCVVCGAPRPRGAKYTCSLRCSGIRRRGAMNHRYNGGLCFNKIHRRWVIHCGKLMHFARAVMAAQVGRLLRSDEIVHHVNGDTTDDAPENLQIVTRAEHILMHRAELMAGRRR